MHKRLGLLYEYEINFCAKFWLGLKASICLLPAPRSISCPSLSISETWEADVYGQHLSGFLVGLLVGVGQQEAPAGDWDRRVERSWPQSCCQMV